MIFSNFSIKVQNKAKSFKRNRKIPQEDFTYVCVCVCIGICTCACVHTKTHLLGHTHV